jgi:hypothetical protein
MFWGKTHTVLRVTFQTIVISLHDISSESC